MDPEALRQRVEDQILGHIDSHAWERHQIIEEAQPKNHPDGRGTNGENGWARVKLS